MPTAMIASPHRTGVTTEQARASRFAPADRRDQAFATVEIHRDIAAIAAAWSSLLPVALSSPYQNPDFLRAWADHAGAAEGAKPLIAIARDASGEPTAILPLCATSCFGVRIARFLGGSHVNYNMAVIRRDALDAFAGGEAARLFALTARIAGIDAYVLVNQPVAWMGTPNPLASLPRQPSTDCAFSGPLAASLEEHFTLHMSSKQRSNHRRKMRRFEERGTPRFFRAETQVERRRLLEAFLAQKAAQLSARGIGDAFARPGVRAFLDEACGLTAAPPTVDLYGFEMDGEVVAVTGAISSGSRHSGMFNSITSGEHAKYSPGEILMNFVVEEQIRRGLSSFDLGVGAATYKKLFCPDAEPLFDSIFGVTLKGRATAMALSGAAALKARIKADPRAYGMIEKIRKARASKRPEFDDRIADA